MIDPVWVIIFVQGDKKVRFECELEKIAPILGVNTDKYDYIATASSGKIELILNPDLEAKRVRVEVLDVQLFQPPNELSAYQDYLQSRG